jgi:hypothetical protein
MILAVAPTLTGCAASPAARLEVAAASYQTSLDLIATGAEQGWIDQEDIIRIEPYRTLARTMLDTLLDQAAAGEPIDAGTLDTASSLTRRIAELLRDLQPAANTDAAVTGDLP